MILKTLLVEINVKPELNTVGEAYTGFVIRVNIKYILIR
jgi:hypothetical protein